MIILHFLLLFCCFILSVISIFETIIRVIIGLFIRDFSIISKSISIKLIFKCIDYLNKI